MKRLFFIFFTCLNLVFSYGFHYPYEVWNGTFNSGKYIFPEDLGVEGDLCLGSDCRNSWPSGGGSSFWSKNNSDVYYDVGNVGIGTENPLRTFSVSSHEPVIGLFDEDSTDTTSMGTFVGFYNGSGAERGYVGFGSTSNSNLYLLNRDGNVRIQANGGDIVMNSGNVGIGHSSPSYKLSVNGDIATSSYFVDPSVLSVGTSYNICYNGAGQFGACSSVRKYKTNISDLSLGLDTLKGLRPVEFNWKEEGGFRKDLGFIAEEVESVSPLLASYGMSGNLTGVKYDQMSALLVKVVLEQQEQIDYLLRVVSNLEK